MERVQIDLVDMKSLLVAKGGSNYRYVLTIMDVFSRYLVLRPLCQKTANTVADQLRDVFAILGTPKILQCDQGTEFKGTFRLLMSFFNVKVITSSPYHPESQGKVLQFVKQYVYLCVILVFRLKKVTASGKR